MRPLKGLPIMTQVQSSNIKAIGHRKRSGDDFNVLFVEFVNGSVYKYTPVSKEVEKGFYTAESVGSYFVEKIRNNKDLKVTKIV